MKVIKCEYGRSLECKCGNQEHSVGFQPCDREGNEIEPTLASGWSGLYVCSSCGQVYDCKQENGRVLVAPLVNNRKRARAFERSGSRKLF